MSDKAKAAVDALKEPGVKGPDRSASAREETDAPDRSAGLARSADRTRRSPTAPLRRLAGFWRGYWPDIDLDALARDVESRLAQAAGAWELSDVRPLAGGNVALVCAAVRAGRPVVLKTNPRGSPDDVLLASEAATLAFWRSTGAAIELLRPARRRLHAAARAGVARPPAPPRDGELGGQAGRAGEARAPAARCRDTAHGGLADERVRGELAGRRAERVRARRLRLPLADDVLVHLDLHPGNALGRTATGRSSTHTARAPTGSEVWALICPEAPALPDDPADARRNARPGSRCTRGPRGSTRDGLPRGPACARRRGRLRRRRRRPRLGGAPAPDREGAQPGLTPNGGLGGSRVGFALTGSGQRDDWRARMEFARVRELLRHRGGTAHRERRRA